MVPFLKQACSWSPMSAICVQSFDDSLSPAIHTRYRISLRSSSLREPRYPLLRVVFGFKSQRTTGAGCWTKADSGLALQASGIPSPIMPYQALTLSAQDTQVGLKQLDTLVIRTREGKQLDTRYPHKHLPSNWTLQLVIRTREGKQLGTRYPHKHLPSNWTLQLSAQEPPKVPSNWTMPTPKRTHQAQQTIYSSNASSVEADIRVSP